MSGYTVLPQSWSPGLTQARMSSGGRLGRTSLIQDKLAQPSKLSINRISLSYVSCSFDKLHLDLDNTILLSLAFP